MAYLTKFQKNLGFRLWGKIGKAGEPDPLGVAGIYRRRPGPKRTTIVHMDFYDPGPPVDPGQIVAQEKFAAGVLAWQGLSDEEKLVYNERSKKLLMCGYNLFLREYMLS